MQTYGAGELPIVNRTGGTIPAGSVARVAGRDSTDPAFWEVAQPNGADLARIVVVAEDLPDDRKGTGLLFTHPRTILHSEGVGLSPGDYLGTASGAWQAAAGTTLLVWSCTSTEATVTWQPAAAADAGEGLWCPTSDFYIYTDGIVANTWKRVTGMVLGSASAEAYFKARHAGTLVGLHVNYHSGSTGCEGNIRFGVAKSSAPDTLLTGSPYTEWIVCAQAGIDERINTATEGEGAAAIAKGDLLAPVFQVSSMPDAPGDYINDATVRVTLDIAAAA